MLRQLLQQHRGRETLLRPRQRLRFWCWGFAAARPTAPSDITGSLGDKTETSHAADPRRELDSYRERFRANPKDADAALQYGKALRATGQRAQAVAVLEAGHAR